MLIYLETRINDEIGRLDDDDDGLIRYFKKIHSMIVSANEFMKTLYHAALFLTVTERDVLIRTGRNVEQLYRKCANYAFHHDLTRFKIQPKYHMLGELIFQLENDKEHQRCSISPLSFSTQMDEDFVGHISMASRKVSIRTLHERTIGRYKVSLAMHWDKRPD